MLSVRSEIGHLRRVLLHEPGIEVDRMVPTMMQELLFDDILFGEAARDEHARFRRVLQFLGVELVDALDLLVQTLEGEEARAWVADVLLSDTPHALSEEWTAAPPARLAEMLVGGLRTVTPGSGGEVADLYQVAPLPNWCFQRDPQVVIGEGVVLSAMATAARHREGLLTRLIFRFHPQLRSTPVLYDPLEADRGAHSLFVEAEKPCIEGGDVLVLSPDVIAVGRSLRTNRTGILRLARALSRREDSPRWMIVVKIPQRRAYMHLDTLLTPLDRDACLVYSPVILDSGSQRAEVYEVDLHDRDLAFTAKTDMLSALAARGVDLKPIPCGGPDPVAQQREQWTDGANTLAVAPGVITLYDRNLGTAEELARHGFKVVEADDLLLGREEVSLEAGRRLCILLASHELSRARGGPHCLVHPLVRDAV